MELDKQQEIEYLKRDLHSLEREEADLLSQLEKIRRAKNELLDRISESTDEQYEQEALSLLYQQKRNKK